MIWCSTHRYTATLVIAPPAESAHRAVFGTDEMRWQLARHLLHDGTLATPDRVTGLLVLLYGQTVSRIVRLSTSDVVRTDGQVQLRLGQHPLTVPGPLDELLEELVAARCGKAALGHSDDHPWLFPGGLPGAAMHPTSLSNRLGRLGVPVRISRNTALMQNAAIMPAKVLSDLLGLSVRGATRWTELADASGDTYAADLAHRHHAGTMRDLTSVNSSER